MTELPVPIRRRLRRLARRLAVGLFLDIWPRWAAAGLLVAGIVVLGCRILFPRAAPFLIWLWILPAIALVPAAIVGWLRRFRHDDLLAAADSLAGGSGTLLAVAETRDLRWTESSALDRASAFALPRIRPWRALKPVAASAVFLAAALALPQRTVRASDAPLAGDIAKSLTATVTQLKQQQMITPEEEKALDEAIERIRRGAEKRVDASSWEAADALREKMAADLGEKQNAAKWAEESLARYAAAAASGGAPAGESAEAAELTKALERLAKSGLLANAPADLKARLENGKLPLDAASLRELSASLGKYLKETNGRIGELAKLGKEFGRFNPADFPLEEGASANGDGEPGRGGVDRGRADADLTWGKETALFDKFKATPLPPGAARSPDDWAPIVELPGAPQASPELGASAAARQYADVVGQGAWRRALAPRHQSAVKKYFAK